jgi:enoyl-CoA hydratase/carnithine racemase
MSISPSEKIKVSIEGNIATIVIDNPGANTWDRESLPALRQVIETLNQEPTVYALVLTGAGQKFFSAGADLNQFASGDADVARAVGEAFGEAFETLADFRGVSIAAINGFAMGGGLEVALACDIRIAEEQAALALPEARVGLLPCAGGTQRLTQLVGEGWAKRMILCGERIGAEQARTLASKVGNQSPTSVAACKRLIHSARNVAIADGLAAERDEFVALFSTEDQREGTNAFLEKREPEWKNQ